MAILILVLVACVEDLNEVRTDVFADVEHNEERANLIQNRDDCYQIVAVRVLDSQLKKQ